LSWTVFYINDELSTPLSLEMLRDRNSNSFEMTEMNFFLHYNKIITYDFNYMNQTESEQSLALLWRMTQNIDSSWLREPYENIVDKAERHLEELDTRSAMIGDIYMDRKERKWYIVKPIGFQEITWIKGDEQEVNTGCKTCGCSLPSGMSMCDNCFDDSYVEGDDD